MSLAKLVGYNVWQKRLYRSLSQEELARLIGRTPSFIDKIESGRTNVSLRVIEKLSESLQVEPIEFFVISTH